MAWSERVKSCLSQNTKERLLGVAKISKLQVKCGITWTSLGPCISPITPSKGEDWQEVVMSTEWSEVEEEGRAVILEVER